MADEMKGQEVRLTVDLSDADRLKFSLSHIADFQAEQKRIEQQGMRYPLMKLADMYFHQIGLQIEAAKAGSSKR